MTTSPFAWFELRTTNTHGAAAFYAAVLGLSAREAAGALLLTDGDAVVAGVATLPERAAARGAPAHWLGHVGVADVDAAVRRFTALGGEALGPRLGGEGGVERAGLRDPFGSVLAVASGVAPEARSPVVWSQLNTTDVARATAFYEGAFGWSPTGALDVAADAGEHRSFAWAPGGVAVGSIADTARRPGVHPHWLFFFRVADLDAAVERLNAGGGEVLGGVVRLPGGDRVAICHDPEGAAFALAVRAPRGA